MASGDEGSALRGQVRPLVTRSREEAVRRLEEIERLLDLGSLPVVALPYRDLVTGERARPEPGSSLDTSVRTANGKGVKQHMARTEYYEDPNASVPNSLVVAASAAVVDDGGRLLSQRRVVKGCGRPPHTG